MSELDILFVLLLITCAVSHYSDTIIDIIKQQCPIRRVGDEPTIDTVKFV